ncbi:AMP-binding protein [Novosphingobium olei]|uniref:AMP-binding protein n=1 Tax=Novosphingobium olei TaxID=2728851 RepID=UPI0030905612|nr:AMP-binding protein [Novosphingobium olei]
MSSRVNDLARLIEREAAAQPDFPVLTFVHVEADGSLGSTVRNYGSLWSNGRKFAAWLQQQGVAPGDSVVVMMRNYPEFVEVMVASALIGAVLVPIDSRSMGEKLAYMIDHVGAEVVIAEASALPALDAVMPQLVAKPTLLSIDDYAGLALVNITPRPVEDVWNTCDTRLAPLMPDPHAPMYLMFTSGTTGNPKAVVRTHASYMKGLKGLRALGVQQGDVLYTGLPLCHINAHSTLAAGLSMGLRTVISRQFTKSRLWEVCRAHGCTVFTLLGGMIPEIYAVPARDDDAANPVRLVISSGMPADLWEKYEKRFGVTITEVYGSTENGGTLINRMGEGPRGSMGKPPKGLIAAVLDEQDRPCAPYQPGNLCFRKEVGGTEPIAYFGNAKASAEKVAGGWFRSGDIAYVDENGWFYFQHRVGGGVRRNGDFVNTALVETVLAQSPAVLDVYVYGVATARNVAGEKALVAAVVLAEGNGIADVQVWAAGHLQRNEIPEIWQVLPDIPKTVSQKPVERECIALLQSVGLLSAYEERRA